MDSRTILSMLQAAYLIGFGASGEGYNGEYPFADHNRNPEEDEEWRKERDKFLAEMEAELLSRGIE